MVELDEVRVLSTHVVQARDCKNQRIELTPCDLMSLLSPPMQHGLVFLKPPPSSVTSTTFVEHLKKSLSSTLDFFFPLTGRLVAVVEHDTDDDADESKKSTTSTSFFIDCNNEGAQFVHAVADRVSIADILEPVYVPSILHSFFSLDEIKRSYEDVSKPLLGIQVTELVDGVFIGCVVNHMVADGSSFWNFLNSWSEISHMTTISKPPVFDRGSFFGSISCYPIKIPSSLFKQIEDEKEEFNTPPPALERRVFHFSKTKIAEVKTRTNIAADHQGGGSNISSLQSIMSHVWRSMLQTRGFNDNLVEEMITCFVHLIGMRSRVHPALPDEYFGNAFDIEVVRLKVQDIIDHESGLGFAALQLHKVVASHSEEKVRRNLERWVHNLVMIINDGVLANMYSFVNSPRFNVYGNDFGWGKPIAVRGRRLMVDGMIRVLPGMEEGSMDIDICSTPETLEIMGNDPNFN